MNSPHFASTGRIRISSQLMSHMKAVQWRAACGPRYFTGRGVGARHGQNTVSNTPTKTLTITNTITLFSNKCSNRINGVIVRYTATVSNKVTETNTVTVINTVTLSNTVTVTNTETVIFTETVNKE